MFFNCRHHLSYLHQHLAFPVEPLTRGDTFWVCRVVDFLSASSSCASHTGNACAHLITYKCMSPYVSDTIQYLSTCLIPFSGSVRVWYHSVSQYVSDSIQCSDYLQPCVKNWFNVSYKTSLSNLQPCITRPHFLTFGVRFIVVCSRLACNRNIRIHILPLLLGETKHFSACPKCSNIDS